MRSISRVGVLSFLAFLFLMSYGCPYGYYTYCSGHMSLVGEWNLSVGGVTMQSVFEGTDVQGKALLIIDQETQLAGGYSVQENLITFACTGKVEGESRSYCFKGIFLKPGNIGGTVRISTGVSGANDESEFEWEGLKQ